MSKENNKKEKQEKVKVSLKLPPIYPSSECLFYHPIHWNGRGRESCGNDVPLSCYPPSVQIAKVNTEEAERRTQKSS